MAVAYVDGQHTGDVDGFVTSTSIGSNLSITGSDICIVAHTMNSDGDADPGTAPSGVTFDTPTAQNLTSQVDQVGTAVRVNLWTLLAPTGTTDTVTATWSGSQTRAWVCASSYSGVDSIGNTQSSSGTSGEPSLTVTGVGDDDMVADIVGTFGGTTSFTVGANQTKILDSTTFHSYYVTEASTSYQDGVNGGVMEWTTNNSLDWAHAALALLAPAASVSIPVIMNHRRQMNQISLG